MTAYTFLRPGGTGFFTGFRWPLPDHGPPGGWVDALVQPCRSGIHACRARPRQSDWLVQHLGLSS